MNTKPNSESNLKQKKCFVICPIGAADSPERKWSDDIFDNLIVPACDKFGCKPTRSIDNDRPGDITNRILEELSSADFVIADLTTHNPNVFFELALAYDWNKPVVLLEGDGKKAPFDIASMNVISIRVASFKGTSEAMKALERHLKAILEGQKVSDNPVARFQQHRQAMASGTPTDKKIENLAAEIASLRRSQNDLLSVVEGYKYLLASATSSGLGVSTGYPTPYPTTFGSPAVNNLAVTPGYFGQYVNPLNNITDIADSIARQPAQKKK